MRPRNKIESISDIVKNPAIRVEFPPEHHQDFIDIGAVADTYNINMTNFARNIWLVWMRKFKTVADINFKNKMISEVIQSMHGIDQIDIFSKYETWENISGAKQLGPLKKPNKTMEKAMNKVKKKHPLAIAKKGKKK